MTAPAPGAHGADWLAGWRAGAIGPAAALARFDALDGVEPEAMLGHWRGAELPTEHPFDGLLEALGWEGKSFDSATEVQPLLFRSRGGSAALDPGRLPAGSLRRWPWLAESRAARAVARAVFPAALALLRTDRPAARLYTITFRDRPSAAMVYDRQPIVDHFRRVDDRTLLGLMDMRGVAPFFFLLERARH